MQLWREATATATAQLGTQELDILMEPRLPKGPYRVLLQRC